MFTPTGRETQLAFAAWTARWMSRATTRVDVPSSVDLPTDRPVLFVANHTSLFDSLASLIALQRFGISARIGIGARYFRHRLLGSALRSTGAIPFSRRLRNEAEREMTAALKRRQACALMPEGRIITPTKRIRGVGTGRPGAARIAAAVGAALVPVGIGGADTAWPPDSTVPKLWQRSSSVTLSFGAPFVVTGSDVRSDTDLISQEVSRAHESRAGLATDVSA